MWFSYFHSIHLAVNCSFHIVRRQHMTGKICTVIQQLIICLFSSKNNLHAYKYQCSQWNSRCKILSLELKII